MYKQVKINREFLQFEIFCIKRWSAGPSISHFCHRNLCAKFETIQSIKSSWSSSSMRKSQVCDILLTYQTKCVIVNSEYSFSSLRIKAIFLNLTWHAFSFKDREIDTKQSIFQNLFLYQLKKFKYVNSCIFDLIFCVSKITVYACRYSRVNVWKPEQHSDWLCRLIFGGGANFIGKNKRYVKHSMLIYLGSTNHSVCLWCDVFMCWKICEIGR